MLVAILVFSLVSAIILVLAVIFCIDFLSTYGKEETEKKKQLILYKCTDAELVEELLRRKEKDFIRNSIKAVIDEERAE